MKNIWTKICASLFLSTLVLLSMATSVSAQCPVCTAAVMGGVGVSRWLNIDDTIAGLWVGAFLVSISWWTINWLNSKKIKFIGRKLLVVSLYYFLTIVPLYWTNFIGHPMNKVWGIDKLVFGIGIGTILYYISTVSYQYFKARNDGKAHFPYEKIVFALVPMAILSLFFYFIFKPI